MAATARGMTMNKPSGSMASELQAASFEDAATELGSVLAEYVSVSRVFLVFEPQPNTCLSCFFIFPSLKEDVVFLEAPDDAMFFAYLLEVLT